MTTGPALVWYAAYGSNVWSRRFHTYLTGGRPPGAGRPMRGARDPSLPAADAPCELPFALAFVGQSRVWGGGLATLITDGPADATALGRRYLITRQQFADVLAQESGRPLDASDAAAAVFDSADPIVVGPGRYDLVVPIGSADGVPVLTFTMPTHTRPAHNPPSAAYTACIVQGLVESHGLGVDDARVYVEEATRRSPTDRHTR